MKYTKLLWILWGVITLCGCEKTPLQQEALPVVSFGDSLVQVFENAGQQTLAVNLSIPAPADMTVRVLLKSAVNAQEGVDFRIPAYEIHVKAGVSTANLNFELVNDQIVNDARSFKLEVIDDSRYQKDSQKPVCHIDILDDESDVAVAFGTLVKQLDESDATYYLPVDLVGKSSGEVKFIVEPIDSSAHEGVHYRIPDKEISVTASDFKGVPVTLINDTEVTPDRVFAVRIAKVVGAARITAKSVCLVTIRNNDVGFQIQRTAEMEEQPGNAESLKIPVKLTGQHPAADLNIQVGVVDGIGNAVAGTDFEFVNNGMIKVPAGDSTFNIEVRPKYNSAITGDKDFRLTVQKVTGSGDVDLREQYGDITLHDYDTEIIFDETGYFVGLDVVSLKVPVKLSQAVYHPIHLNITSALARSADFVVENSDIMIPAGVTDTMVLVKLGSQPAAFKISLNAVEGVEQPAYILQPDCEIETNMTADIDKSDWEIDSFTSEEPSGEGANNGHAIQLIDGNDKSFWHSRWLGGNDQGPFDIVIDLQKLTAVSHIRCCRRLTHADTKKVSFHLSVGDNKEAWTALGEKSFSTSWVEIDVMKQNPAGRYFKVIVEECNGNTVASLGEIYLKEFVGN